MYIHTVYLNIQPVMVEYLSLTLSYLFPHISLFLPKNICTIANSLKTHYTNPGHKSDLCYSVQTVFLRPNYTENMDKMDVSAHQIAQSHTRIQNIPLRFQGFSLSIIFAMVKVFPEPVTPSKVWN